MKLYTFKSTTPLPVEVSRQYAVLGELPDGRICGVHRLLYHWTLHIGIDEYGYGDRYCYETLEGAMWAMQKWNGDYEPEGWHRHPHTGRRRDLKTGREWVDY